MSGKSEESQFATGDRVTHAKFGNGTVTELHGGKVTVDFGKGEKKHIAQRFLSLASGFSRDNNLIPLHPNRLPSADLWVTRENEDNPPTSTTSEHKAPEPELLETLDLAALANNPAKPRQFAIERIAPLGEVTMLFGPGSGGKSLLGQQLATAAAAGLGQCLGLSIIETASVYLSCEDDRRELEWRQERLCEGLDVSLPALAGKLHLVSWRGKLDNELAVFSSDGRMSLTKAFADIAHSVRTFKSRLVFPDNVAHLFTGNENDRADVTRFVNLLNRLAAATGAAIVLIGHPNKAGDEYSGSTAWNNAVRSRLYLEHDEDTDLRKLSLPKANYSQKGAIVSFYWCAGTFVRDVDLPEDQRAEMAQVAKHTAANAAFLRCLAQRTKEKRHVSEKVGANYAPKVFAGMDEAKGFKKQDLTEAMDRLFRLGRIERGLLWRDTAEGKDIFGLKETGNATGNAPETRSADHRKPAEIDRETHPLYTTYISGAALGSAAPDENEGAA